MKCAIRRLVAAAAVLAACGDDQDPEGARELLARVRAEQYQLWERAPGYETRQPTSAPHSDRVDIFVNSVLADALASSVALTSWPVGSLVVKDGYSSGELELIAIMERREDEWFFAEYDDEGDSEFSGLPSTCTDCHTTSNDRILAFDLPSGAAPDP